MKRCIEEWFAREMPDVDEAARESILGEYSDTVRKLGAELALLRSEGAAAEARIAFIAHSLEGSSLMIGDTALHDALVAWREAFKRDAAAAESRWPALADELART